MDFNSSDGTREVLQKYIHHPNLDIILSSEHGIPQLHQWLRHRAYLDLSTDHIIYMDPDEMMVLKPGHTIEDVIHTEKGFVNDFLGIISSTQFR